MRFLVLMCLWLCVACKATVRPPFSDLHAVTDGRVTLGVVPSENEEGLQAYRLLLCKRFAVYNAVTFADRTQCLPALIDGNGQEVVIFHNSLRRSFAAKYANYAKIAAGVLLAAGAVYGVHRWFAKGSKYIDNLTSSADEALHIKKSALQEGYDKEIASIKARLDELNVDADKVDKIEQEMQEAFKQADSDALERVLVRIEGIDEQLGEGLRTRLTTRIDQESLENFAKRVAESDYIFAKQIRSNIFAPKAIKQSDLYYFGNNYREVTQMFDREVREKLTRVVAGDPSLKLNRLTVAERTILSMRIRKAQTFANVAMLRQYEMEKELLSQLSEGKLSVADMKKNLHKLTANDSLDVENHIKRVEHLSYLSGDTYSLTRTSSSFGSGSAWDLEQAKGLLADINEEDSLLGRSLPTIEQIHKIAAHREAIRRYEMESFNIKSALSEVNRKSITTYYQLYRSETHRGAALDAGRFIGRESYFWKEIMKLKPATDLYELQSQSLKKEFDVFEANLRARTSDFAATDSFLQTSRGANEELRQLLTEHQDNAVQRLREAVQALEEGNTARVQDLQQAADKERQAWGLAGLSAGFAATAVLTALDKSIWGHGEKQLGDYWSQIFSEQASFAAAAAVEDMPGCPQQAGRSFWLQGQCRRTATVPVMSAAVTEGGVVT